MVKTKKKMETWQPIMLITLGTILLMCSAVVISNVIRGYISKDFRAELNNFVEIYVTATEGIEVESNALVFLENLDKEKTEGCLIELEESCKKMVIMAKHKNEIDIIIRIPEYVAQLQEFVEFKDSPAKEKPYEGFNHDVGLCFDILEMYTANLIEDPTRI